MQISDVRCQIIRKLFLHTTCYILLAILLSSSISAQADATVAGVTKDHEASNSVREKVREAIENLTRKPKAVVGTLSQVTDSTLVIKTLDDKVVQVATSTQTKYARYNRGKKSDIKFEELVLGEFIVAMGFRNGNEIVDAKRVLIYDAAPFAKKQTVMGKVLEFSKNKITLLRAGNNNGWTVNVTKNTQVTRQAVSGGMENVKTNDIEISDKIIVAGVLDNKDTSTISAGAIYIFPNQNVQKTSSVKSPSPKPSSTVKPGSPTP